MLSFVPELDKQFAQFAEDALHTEILDERELALATLATAFTLEDGDMVKQAIIEAKQVGITNQEIGQISAIVITQRAKKIMRLGMVSAPSAQSKPTVSACCQ